MSRLNDAISRLQSRPQLSYAELLDSITGNLAIVANALREQPEISRSIEAQQALGRTASFLAQADLSKATPDQVYEAATLQETLLRLFTRTVRIPDDEQGEGMRAFIREGMQTARYARLLLHTDGFVERRGVR